jgi:hypothetical protein
MRFSLVIVVIVFIFVPVALLPRIGTGIPGDATVGQAGDTCGRDFELSYYNDINQSGDFITEASGILAGLLQGTLEGGQLGLFSGCSKLDVASRICYGFRADIPLFVLWFDEY